MNETILTPRQKFILNTINQSEGMLREEIQEKLEGRYPASRPTVIRDLNILVGKKLVRLEGKTKGATYLPETTNQLFRKFDVERYFADDPDNRVGAKKTFDFGIIELLDGDLFSTDEKELLRGCSRSFQKETSELNPDILRRELERFVIELSWKSSKIEGNTYTLLETEALIKEQKEAQGKSKMEAVMILNHKNAFELILANKEQFNELSISDISQLHNALIKDLGVASGIRKQAVGITGTVYRPLDNEHQIREVLEKVVVIINNKQNVLEKALIAGFMIPYIQSYADGNKRTARMLTNAILLAGDLFPLSYRSINEDEFKKSLILFYEQGSIEEIKRLFIEQVKFSNEVYFE